MGYNGPAVPTCFYVLGVIGYPGRIGVLSCLVFCVQIYIVFTFCGEGMGLPFVGFPSMDV